jgi:hypothetical protein
MQPRFPHYFEKTDENPFIPVGLNLCFPRFATSTEDGLATMFQWLDKLAQNGGNYARIFLEHSFFDVEKKGFGQFDETQAARLDSVLARAWSKGIRLKITLELFRNIEETQQKESFPGAVNFSRVNYHLRHGGPFRSVEDFFQSCTGKKHFLKKLDWLAQRYPGHPGIFGWDLWNEVNSIRGNSWQKWTEEMLPELKKRFPNHLAMQNLASLEGDYSVQSYKDIIPIPDNEVAQVHRYLDLGAPWTICHGPIDTMMADAITFLRQIAPRKPALLSEGGAVEPRHIRPWDLYSKDTEGLVLHDILFAPFFSGAAGCGSSWHWQEYVDRNNLWWQFKRFSKAIEGLNPIEEQWQPCRKDTNRLRVYILQGKRTSIIWCRDSLSGWQEELVDGAVAQTISHQKIELPTGISNSEFNIVFYDPWLDREIRQNNPSSNIIALPPFTRSLIIRITHSRR